MQPQIAYARTADGVNIAYWSLGEGPALVSMTPPPFSHLQLEWDDPETRSWYQALAERYRLCRYDGRGTGLSSREVADFSIRGQITDLQAVLDADGTTRCALFAPFYAGPAAITFAVERPERVSHLILWHSFARAADYSSTPQTQALLGLLDHDWGLFAETFAHARRGWSSGEAARRFARLVRESVEPHVLREAFEQFRSIDVSSLLQSVAVPTLVLHRRDFTPASGTTANRPYLSIPRELASAIRGARLVLVDGDTGPPYAEPFGDILAAIDEHLGVPRRAADPPAPTKALREAISAREETVLKLIARGLSNKEIAADLGLSVNTVERHISNTYRKIGARGRAEATAYALRNHIA